MKVEGFYTFFLKERLSSLCVYVKVVRMKEVDGKLCSLVYRLKHGDYGRHSYRLMLIFGDIGVFDSMDNVTK